MSQTTEAQTTQPTSEEVIGKVNESIAALQEAQKTVVEGAQLLAAPGQQPVVRINNARYMLDGRRDFMDTLAKTSAQIADLPAGTIVLDEADPCPQNRYSMGATELVHHLVMNTLEGCGGAKIWLTRLGNAHETASGRAGVVYLVPVLCRALGVQAQTYAFS